MKGLKASVTRALPVGSVVSTCDNSGAKEVKIISVQNYGGVKRRIPSAGVGDLVQVTVKKGRPDMMHQLFFGVVVRQKKEYRRADGTRIKFQSNAVVVLKDEKGNPKGTIFKGPIAKEATVRWPGVAKVARIII